MAATAAAINGSANRFLIPPCSMTAKLELVSPEMAAAALLNMRPQRNLRKSRVEAYCRDLQDGQWVITHQGVAFDIEGRLIDGQHRLTMVVETGVPTWFLVVRDVPLEAMLHIDDQAQRSVFDTFKIMGVEEDKDAVTIARSYEAFPSNSPPGFMTRAEIVRVLDQYREGIQFACAKLPRIMGISRGVRILAARAYYHIAEERLAEWCSVITSGMPVSANAKDDSAAITFRNLLLRVKSSDYRVENDRYCKGQCALRSFVSREPMTRVYGTEADLFPLKS